MDNHMLYYIIRKRCGKNRKDDSEYENNEKSNYQGCDILFADHADAGIRGEGK